MHQKHKLDNLKKMMGKIRRKHSKNYINFFCKNQKSVQTLFSHCTSKAVQKKLRLNSFALLLFPNTANLKSFTPLLIQTDNKNSKGEKI